MRTTRAVGVTTALVGLLAAAGCGGSSGGPAATSQSTAAKHTASPKPLPPKPTPTPSTSSATPTSSGTAAGAPGVPESARQHTKAGAKAFAEYYMARTNALFRDPQKGTVDELDLPSCTPCAQNNQGLRDMASKHQHFDRDQVVFRTTHVWETSKTTMDVFMDMSQNPARLLDASGKVISTTPTPHVKGVVLLAWQDHRGWRVKDLTHE